MFESIRNIFKRGLKKPPANKECKSHLLKWLAKLIEDILLWKNMWLSCSCIIFINIIFFICLCKDVSLLQLVAGLATILLSIDALETWLKYKHRSSFLQHITYCDSVKMYQAMVLCQIWIKKKWSAYILLRETNHTKAFFLMNFFFGIIYVIGKSLSGYTLMYIMLMGSSVSHLVLPYIKEAIHKIKLHAETGIEMESLIPTVSEQEMNELSHEFTEANEQQSLDYWKLEDLQAEDSSDSSENSSLITNLSKDQLQAIERDVDDSSESSDDEYIPKAQQEEQLQSTLEIIHGDTWGQSAYSALFNVTSAVANMIYTSKPSRRNPVSNVDSDSFEFINKNEFS